MPLPDYQQTVADFVASRDLETSVQARLLDLVSEVGEVAKEALKGSDYGRIDFAPGPNWEGELADAFFSLICVANNTGVNLDGALAAALDKYAARLADSGDAGSGR